MIKKATLPSPIEVLILGYCLWQASDLVSSWLTAPAERYAWIAFIIWCIPVVWYVARTMQKQETKQSTPELLGVAIATSLIGGLGSLNILEHIGLALAFAGMLPFRWPNTVWIATALSWLPSFGWMIKILPFALIPIIQIGLAAFGTGCLFYYWRRS